MNELFIYTVIEQLVEPCPALQCDGKIHRANCESEKQMINQYNAMCIVIRVCKILCDIT